MRSTRFAWAELGKLRTSRLVQTMHIWLVLVPVLANALADVGASANVTVFDHTLVLNLALPFSWKLFYFSALSFTIANLLYLWKCSSLIRDNRDFAHFKAKGKDITHLARYAMEAGENDLVRTIHQQPLDRPQTEKAFLGIFWKIYEKLNYAQPITRMSCGAAYAFGFLLLGIVFFQNLATVLEHASPLW